jgi:hypothetical protein
MQTDISGGSITIERTAGVPEPSSLLLLMSAGIMMFGARRFKEYQF